MTCFVAGLPERDYASIAFSFAIQMCGRLYITHGVATPTSLFFFSLLDPVLFLSFKYTHDTQAVAKPPAKRPIIVKTRSMASKHVIIKCVTLTTIAISM